MSDEVGVWYGEVLPRVGAGCKMSRIPLIGGLK